MFAEALKFDPAQPRDREGQWSRTSSRGMTLEAFIERMESEQGRKYLKPTQHLSSLGDGGFVLPDGRMFEVIQGDHEYAAQRIWNFTDHEYNLNDVLEVGVMRVRGSGIEVGAPITQKQASRAYEMRAVDDAGESLFVDVAINRKPVESFNFGGDHRRFTADTIRNRIKAVFANRLSKILKWNPDQPRDEQGRWVAKLIKARQAWIPYALEGYPGALEAVNTINALLDQTPEGKKHRVALWDPAQPRDKKGRWAKQGIPATMAAFKAKYPAVAENYLRSSHTEMGSIEEHTGDVAREWQKQLTPQELQGISDRFGSDVEAVMMAAIPLHDIGKAEAIESGHGKEAQHEFTIPILQDVMRQEGFSDKDITLATELTNHDLIGPLFRGYEGFKSNEAKVVQALKDKAEKVGMSVSDFVTLQLAFYQADASAYPYVTQFMRQEPSGKWTFKGNKKIAAIEALLQSSATKFDPNQPRDEDGKWSKAEYDRQQEKHDRYLAVNGYVHGNFRFVNKALREPEHRKSLEEVPQYITSFREQVAALDAIVRDNPLPQDETVHRIMRTAVVEGLREGDVFQDDGFISTTRDETMLSNIESDLGYTSLADLAHLEIEVPKGTGHIDVNKEMGDSEYGEQYRHQQEVILPRGTQFEVVSVEETPVELENITRKNRRLRLRVVHG